MKNIKLRIIAASLSALAVVSSLSVVSASAAETTKSPDYQITDEDYDTIYPDLFDPNEMEKFLMKLDAYNKAKNHLENIGYESDVIDSVLIRPDAPTAQTLDFTEILPGIKESNETKDFFIKFSAYISANKHLQELGFYAEIIDAVVVIPKYQAPPFEPSEPSAPFASIN